MKNKGLTISELCNQLQDIAHEGEAQSYVLVNGKEIEKVRFGEDGYAHIITKSSTEDLEEPPGLWQC